MQGINLRRALEDVKEYWSPRVLGQVNDQYIKVAKVKGEFTWHKHDNEDEMFLVVYGRLVLQVEDGEGVLDSGDFYVVPKGKLHNPVADEECGLALIETVTTLHTGDVKRRLASRLPSSLPGDERVRRSVTRARYTLGNSTSMRVGICSQQP
jgi:mannose-6-phosphate isomerase-like protein (cupin superfamily)